ncbi:MAG: hypothetical protein C0404_11060 [Verrucomicrobia bacterium]|nr:hypothetical protein [Verrucomicrobiota bacterium]
MIRGSHPGTGTAPCILTARARKYEIARRAREAYVPFYYCVKNNHVGTQEAFPFPVTVSRARQATWS